MSLGSFPRSDARNIPREGFDLTLNKAGIIWLNQKKCGSVRQQTVGIFTTLTKGIERAKSPKERGLKIYRMTGNAPCAVPANRHSGLLQVPAL
jgi:hypothetical protein